MEKVRLVRMSPSYGTFIGGFIVFLAVTLLALLDVRRGFLFDVYPVRTLFYVFTPMHGLMLTSGFVGMIACYWGATSRESRLSDTSRYVKGLTFVIFALLVIDLFAYRGVPAARSLASGRINADWLQASRGGASTNFLLSFVIGAPMLNITTVVLALALLPAPFAITRIVAGVFVTVVVTYMVARIADEWDHPQVAMARTGPDTGRLQRLLGAYLRPFDRDRIPGSRRETLETPSQLFRVWLQASGRIALVLVPALWVWSVVAAAIFQALPSAFGNNLPSVVLAAVGARSS